MAITTKFVLRTNKKLSNGEHPIMLRITEDRKSIFVSTKKSASSIHWDDAQQLASKAHPNAKAINSLLHNIHLKLSFYFANIEEGHSPRVEMIKDMVERLTGAIKKVPKMKLLEFFTQEVDRLKALERYGYAGVFHVTLSRLKKFMGDEDMAFVDIDINFIRRFEDWQVHRGIALTTRSIDLRGFRTIWRNAIKEKHCPENHYPFKDFAFGKYNNPKTKKRAISQEQFKKIAELDLGDDDKLINSRNYFMFSYYCRGLNFTDLASLKWVNITDGFINYVRAKTKEEFSFKLHPVALQILEYYKNLEGNSDAGYVFPILYKRHATIRSERDRKQKIRTRVNGDLKTMAEMAGIEKNITTYVARHTYATTLKAKGHTIEEIGKTLGHDNTKTTEIYLDEIGDPLFDDRINESI